MRRMLVTCFAALMGLAGWAGPAGAELVSTAAPVSAIQPATGLSESVPEAAPDALLRAATLVAIAELEQDRNLQTNSPEKFAELLESTILPLFDFQHMARLAVARNWRLASSKQKDALVAGFRTLLVRTYSTALTNYHDQAITYKTLRIAPGETDVTVRSTMKQPGAERIAIDYDMEHTPAGWKIYDVRIEGISLIAGYRSPFAQIIRDDGVDGLIESLAARNRQVEPRPRSDKRGTHYFLMMYSMMQNFFRGDR